MAINTQSSLPYPPAYHGQMENCENDGPRSRRKISSEALSTETNYSIVSPHSPIFKETQSSSTTTTTTTLRKRNQQK